ncbi:MAG TPA: SDR family oxidoreductase [Rhodospirillales bacterium]|jgi:NAD(P)-dependent dehydrogenase (short-subunit alcohol dehydrogenase family)|nr:SDR family oxidoreductase [Rhodospirillales bacterium]
MELEGKVALITGGARGIGAAIVRAAVGAGADVVIHHEGAGDRTHAEALAAEFDDGRCLLAAADFLDDAQIFGLWRAATAWKGRVDVLVNNAGIHAYASVDAELETWRQAWRQTLQINTCAPAYLCREAVLHFRSTGGGVIVSIASQAAHGGVGDSATIAYGASKAAIKSLTQSIARGFAADGVLAYVIAPGLTGTAMGEDVVRRTGIEPARDLPLGAWVPADEIAALAVFLASGRVRHMSGATLDVNGAALTR